MIERFGLRERVKICVQIHPSSLSERGGVVKVFV